MKKPQELFIELIRDKSKTSEEIYNIMSEKFKENLSTKKILRNLIKWKECVYQGSIGENDFIVSETDSTALSNDNVAMVYDDYKKSIVRFIEMFCEEYEKNPNLPIIIIVYNIAYNYLEDIFVKSSKSGKDVRLKRNKTIFFDENNQMKKYNISSQKNENGVAVCCEMNVSIGNILQFLGYDTYHVSGYLEVKESDRILDSGHAFTLVRHGQGEGSFDLVDIFNGIIVPNALPGNYDLSNGFKVEYFSKEQNQTYIYEIDGPLYELNAEILQVEATIRKLCNQINMIDYCRKKNIETDLNLETIKEEFESLITYIKNSNMNEVFINRFINRIQTYYLDVINKKIEETSQSL